MLLWQALGAQPSLTNVDLSRNRIGLTGSTSLAEVLAEPRCMIATLILAGNRLGDAAIVALGKRPCPSMAFSLCLRRVSLFVVSHLFACSSSRMLAVLSAGSLGCSANLRVVNLQDCTVGDAGAVCLADYLSINKKIEVLDLSWNHIGRKGGRALAGCLTQNEALVDVDLAWNGLGDVEMVENDLGHMEPTQPGATELGGAATRPCPFLCSSRVHTSFIPTARMTQDFTGCVAMQARLRRIRR